MRPKLNSKSKSQMPLSHEYVGSRILANIKMYTLTRAELLFNLCYEIPCSTYTALLSLLVTYFNRTNISNEVKEKPTYPVTLYILFEMLLHFLVLYSIQNQPLLCLRLFN